MTAMTMAYPSGSWLFISETSSNAAGDAAQYDVPEAAEGEVGQHRDRSAHGPTNRFARALPQRHQHRGKEGRDHHVEAKAVWIGGRSQPVAGHGRDDPGDVTCRGGAHDEPGVVAALTLITDREEPGRFHQKMQKRVDLQGR